MNPNTTIKPGKLKKNDLEKFLEAYTQVGLSRISSMPDVESINESNKELKEFEITPNPFEEVDNKLLIGPKAASDGNIYVHATIHPGQDYIKNPKQLREKYEELVRKYYATNKP